MICRPIIALVRLASEPVCCRGRGVLSAVGLGSVSDTLVHNLHCPTVVVKPPAKEDASKD